MGIHTPHEGPNEANKIGEKLGEFDLKLFIIIWIHKLSECDDKIM